MQVANFSKNSKFLGAYSAKNTLYRTSYQISYVYRITYLISGGEGVRTLESKRITLSRRVQLTTMRHLQFRF